MRETDEREREEHWVFFSGWVWSSPLFKIDFMQMGLIMVDFGEHEREREREEHWVF